MAVTKHQVLERMLRNLEMRARWEVGEDAAGGGAGPSYEHKPDVIYCRGFRDGLRDRVPPQLQSAYDEAAKQLQQEGDPEYQTYLTLKAKFETKT